MTSGIAVFQTEETRYSGRTHLATRVPVCAPSGAVVGLVSIAHDVTALKAAEAQLLADKNAAEAAAQANREFLATTSHEVRTLMSGVTGMTSLLLETSLTDEQHEFVDTVRTSGDALLAVINDILDFSKIEAGMLQIETAPYPVRQAVAGALSMVSQQAAAKGLDLSADIDDAVAETIHGDVARVRQVLINLLANAIKFTETGGVRVRVGLDAGTPQALVFSVDRHRRRHRRRPPRRRLRALRAGDALDGPHAWRDGPRALDLPPARRDDGRRADGRLGSGRGLGLPVHRPRGRRRPMPRSCSKRSWPLGRSGTARRPETARRSACPSRRPSPR